MSFRLLRVEAPHFVAGAVFHKQDGKWYCVHAAPILKWMLDKPSDDVLAYLQRKGWRYQSGAITSSNPSSSPTSD